MPTKDVIVKVRVSTLSKERWDRAAELRARPLSEFIREACDAHASVVIGDSIEGLADERLSDARLLKAKQKDYQLGKRSYSPDPR